MKLRMKSQEQKPSILHSQPGARLSLSEVALVAFVATVTDACCRDLSMKPAGWFGIIVS